MRVVEVPSSGNSRRLIHSVACVCIYVSTTKLTLFFSQGTEIKKGLGIDTIFQIDHSMFFFYGKVCGIQCHESAASHFLYSLVDVLLAFGLLQASEA